MSNKDITIHEGQETHMKPKFLIYQSQIATDQDVFSDTCKDVPRADQNTIWQPAFCRVQKGRS